VLRSSLVSAYWLMVDGCILGLIGALLVAPASPAAPELADNALAAPPS